MKGERPSRPKNIPDCYWELIQACWAQDLEDSPTFDQNVEVLKDDKFAFNEY